jgi:hypothetical protein
MTRHTLLAVNEADQEKIMVSLTSKLYDNIMDKVDDIDFGEIPETKGDITKLPNFEKIVECLDIMHKIVTEYKQDPTAVKTVQEAISNVIARKDLFERAFRYKIELPIVLYNSVVLAIISSVSYMISVCIEFIKTPNSDSFNITLDKVAMTKTRQHLLFVNLQKFNESCNKREVDTALEYVIRNNMKNLTGFEFGVIAGGAAIIGLLFGIIPLIREFIFFFFYSRTRVSEFFEAQATLLQLNAANIQSNSTIDKQEREKIAGKQSKVADFFRKISNAIAVKCKEAEVKATKDIVTTNKKYKTDEVLEELPDSASSVLF